MAINMRVGNNDDLSNDLIVINQLDKNATELYDLIIKEGKNRDPIAPTCKYGCTIGATHKGKMCQVCDTLVETPNFDPKYCVQVEELPFINIEILNRVMPQTNTSKTSLLEIFCSGRKRQLSNILAELLREYEEYSGVKMVTADIGSSPKVEPGAVNYKTFLPLYEYMVRKYYKLDPTDPLPHNVYVDRYVIPTAVTISSLGGRAKLDTVKDIKRILELAPRSSLVNRNAISWAGKIVESFYTLMLKIDEDVLSEKKGVYRRYIFGQRVKAVFRATLLNLHTLHAYDDAHLPFHQTLIVFEVQIREFLFREGLSLELIDEEIRNRLPSPNITKAMKMIEKSRLSAVIFRNPSQGYYALMTVRVVKVNYDKPEDKCVYVSPLIYVFANADVDGDQLPVRVCTTARSRDLAEESHPSLTCIANGTNPNTQFEKAGLPKHTALRLAEAISLSSRSEIPDSAFDEVYKHNEVYGRNYRKVLDNKYRSFTHGKFGRKNEYYFDRTLPIDKEDHKSMRPAPYTVNENNAILIERERDDNPTLVSKIEEMLRNEKTTTIK